MFPKMPKDYSSNYENITGKIVDWRLRATEIKCTCVVAAVYFHSETDGLRGLWLLVGEYGGRLCGGDKPESGADNPRIEVV